MSNAASMLCLIGAALLGQREDPIVHTAPAIEVRRGVEQSGGQTAPIPYHYLMYHEIYWGRNYQKPAEKTDWGNPEKDFSRLATTYYHAKGPLGAALWQFDWFPGKPNTFRADARIAASLVGMGAQSQSQLVGLWSEPPVAVLGLNAGTQAAYARPTQVMHFFERNPDLIALSQEARRKPAHFQFITDAQKRGAAVMIFPGDHRATFAKQGGDQFYHLIAVETVKEGADEKLDEALLTREGMQMLMSKLAEEGVICFHTSHRHVDVAKLVASVAHDLGYAAIVGTMPYDPSREVGLFSSEWVMVARQLRYLDSMRRPTASTPAPNWQFAVHDARFVWTDGATNSLAGLWRSSPLVFDLRRRIHNAIRAIMPGANPAKVFNATRPIDEFLNAFDRLSVEMKNRPAQPPPDGPNLRGLPIKLNRNQQQRNPAGGALLSYRMLMYRGINIGINFDKPGPDDRGNPIGDFSRLPTTYYHPKSPVGGAFALLDWFPGPLNTYRSDTRLPASLIGFAGQPWEQLTGLWAEPPVAVLGLELGTPAGCARPSQTFHFTERIPAFIEMSLPKEKKTPTFHYVRDALDRGANLRVFPGEPRPTFAKLGGDKFYRLLVVETYEDGIDKVQKDLLTREGLQMLMGKLREDGIVCYHISNRYYNLEPIVAAAAKDLGYVCLTGHDAGNWPDEVGHFSSQWIMVARTQKYLEPLKAKEPADYVKVRRPGVDDPYWSVPHADARFLWKDGEKNSLRGLYRSDPLAGGLRSYVDDLERVLANFAPYNNVQPITAPLYGMLESLNRWRVEKLNR